MMEVCGDNRFEIIEKAKQAIIESTNIETSPEEMAVLDNILFRCWQMGWIDKYGNKQPDGDLISRQDAIDAFGLSEKTRKYGGDHSGYNTMMLYEIQDVLESLPSAPDSRQRGEWVPVMDKWGAHFVCSKCGAWKYHLDQDFCGNCGARMHKGGEEE